MAVLDEQPQLQVYVECDGEQLPEFDADDNNMTTWSITKYIEAKSGAEFAVQFELRRPYPQYAIFIKLSIDGRHTCSRIIGYKQYGKPKADIKRTFDHVTSTSTDGQCVMRKFCFAELQIEDLDDHDLGAAFTKNLQSMGTITLEAYYIRHLRQVPSKGGRVDKRPAQLGPIPEKALKGEALSHCTELGRAINVPSASSSQTVSTHTIFDYVRPLRLPFATFNFKYRSIAALQSLLVIPRSPGSHPVRVKDEDPRVGGTLELKEKFRVEQVTAESGLKREHPEDDDDVVFVSSLAKRSRSNITINENGAEVIDLT